MAPDAIYVSRIGRGLSVIDRNGFGAGIGNPAFDLGIPIVEGRLGTEVHFGIEVRPGLDRR